MASKKTNSGKIHSLKLINRGVWRQLKPLTLLKSTRMHLLLKNIGMESMTILCWKFKPKLSLSLRNSEGSSNSNNFKLSILLLKRISPKEMMEETQLRITRITIGRLKGRTISKWLLRKIFRNKMEVTQIQTIRNSMGMNKKTKG